MFGNKKKNIEPEVSVTVETIPADFYGGKSPVIKFKEVEKIIDPNGKNNSLTSVEKKYWDKSSAVGGNAKFHLANLLVSPKFLLVATLILFVIFVVAATFYYWQPTKNKVPVAVPVNNQVLSVIPPPTEVAVEPAPTLEVDTNTGINTSTTTAQPIEELKQSILDVPPNYPSVLLGDSLDDDKDYVSDIAEELFTTDPSFLDSDQDKYPDGHEIYNLYNPIGKEPLKLIDSGLISEFVNPIFGYKLYYPKAWIVGNVDADYRSVLFSTLNGENIEVRTIDKSTPGQNFSDWFALWAPNEKISDLKPFVTAFKDNGWQRSDSLVYYFDTPNRVFVILYHTTDSTTVNYRIVIKMMARSFRLSSSNEVLTLPIIEESGVTDNAVTSTATSSNL